MPRFCNKKLTIFDNNSIPVTDSREDIEEISLILDKEIVKYIT